MKLSRKAKASRANGAKSRGPKTPEGRLRSQTHAIRHGMLAKSILLEGEDPETFKLLMAELEHRFSPVDEIELGFIEEMAAAYWRMRRGWIIEAEILNQGIRASSGGSAHASPTPSPAARTSRKSRSSNATKRACIACFSAP